MEKSTSSFHACYIVHGKNPHLSIGNTLFWKIPLVAVDAGAQCADVQKIDGWMMAHWSKIGLWKVKRGGDTVHGINPAPPEIHQTLMENGKLLPTPTNGWQDIFH